MLRHSKIREAFTMLVGVALGEIDDIIKLTTFCPHCVLSFEDSVLALDKEDISENRGVAGFVSIGCLFNRIKS